VFPTLVGKSRFTEDMASVRIGDEAEANRGTLSLTCPMENGKVTHWDDMESIWRHTFDKELRVDPKERVVLLTDNPFTSKTDREKTAQIMFESFDMEGFHIATDCVMAAYTTGNTTGVVVDGGLSSTRCIPVANGTALTAAACVLPIGGSQLSEYMTKLLYQKGYICLTPAGDRELANNMKEKLGYIAADFEEELKKAGNDLKAVEGTYELSDGTPLTIGTERFRCPEALFTTSLLGIESSGIHGNVDSSIVKCPVDLRKELYSNISLTGGNSMFPGFTYRLTKDILSVAEEGTKVSVVAPSDCKYSVWIGASIFSTLSTFPPLIVTKQEYQEEGSAAVHRKCTDRDYFS
jgi:actin